MEEQTQKSDHDSITTLVADFRNMKRSQDDFHLEMRTAMKDIKDNFAGRISEVEADVKLLEEWKIDHIANQENQKNLIKVLIAIGVVILGMMIWHLTGYKI